MGPKMSLSELEAKHGPHYNVVPSFGLEQGVDEKGNPKFRRIDDHSKCGDNMAAHRKQQIPMAMVEYVMLLIRMIALVFPVRSWPADDGRPSASTEDMKGAYRQIALLASQVFLAITAIFNPGTGEVDLHEMYGQPVGAGHAVPNFYRVAEWLCRVCC